jgi:hypothetical protein
MENENENENENLKVNEKQQEKEKININIKEKDNKLINLKYRKFEEVISTLRNSENYKNYWEINCHNFQHKTIRENLCRICGLIKPERAFHCKTCRKCVKKMDHHCSIVNNCIGFNNYKIFINMLFYGLFTIIIMLITLIENLKFYVDEYSICLFTVFSAFLISILSVVFFLLLFFLIFHLSLIGKGITQLEHNFRFHIHDNVYYDKLLNKSLWEKFTNVFGKNPLIWILPIGDLIIY